MVATEDRISRIENQLDDLNGRVSRIEGALDQMNKRMDDMYKLLITLIVIGGGGLTTAVVSLVLQLIKQ